MLTFNVMFDFDAIVSIEYLLNISILPLYGDQSHLGRFACILKSTDGLDYIL